MRCERSWRSLSRPSRIWAATRRNREAAARGGGGPSERGGDVHWRGDCPRGTDPGGGDRGTHPRAAASGGWDRLLRRLAVGQPSTVILLRLRLLLPLLPELL